MIDLLDIKVDVVFKDFFGDKNNKESLENFINSVLGLKGDDLIEVEEFLDPRKMRVEVGRPSTFVDLSVKSKGGERYIIEMQTYNHEGFDKRLLYYLGKDYTEQLNYSHADVHEQKKQVNYHELPKVHIIAIIDFHRCCEKKDGILNGNKVVETYRFKPEFSPSNEHLFDQWRATIIDLKKFNDRPLEELKTDQERWFYILNNASIIKEKELKWLKKIPVFKKALEKLERLSSDPATRKAYEASINELRDHMSVLAASVKEGEKRGLQKGLQKGLKKGLKEGRQEGLKEGLQEGRKKREIEIAKTMRKDKVPVDQISKFTGLSSEEIKNL